MIGEQTLEYARGVQALDPSNPRTLFSKSKFSGTRGEEVAKDCCWNCRYYIVKGDNEPAILSSAVSNVCVYSDKGNDDASLSRSDLGWIDRACPTPPNYVCRFYTERFY